MIWGWKKVKQLFIRQQMDTAGIVPAAPYQEVIPFGMTINDCREDRPKFRREYTGTMPGNIRCTITIRTLYSRSASGELTQPDGRWVMFDPHRVAERILDPVLVPLIEEFCRQVEWLDSEFVSNIPSSFVDEDGVKWVRAA